MCVDHDACHMCCASFSTRHLVKHLVSISMFAANVFSGTLVMLSIIFCDLSAVESVLLQSYSVVVSVQQRRRSSAVATIIIIELTRATVGMPDVRLPQWLARSTDVVASNARGHACTLMIQ